MTQKLIEKNLAHTRMTWWLGWWVRKWSHKGFNDSISTFSKS